MKRKSSELLRILQEVEEGDFTYISGDFPPVLSSARGLYVEDVEGNLYRDLSSFFGVSMLGHSPDFIREEAVRGFFHGMGDLLPSREKVLLLQELSGLLGGGWKGLLLSDGSDAVEACLRTAFLFRGGRRIIAFEGAYHGTSLGSLPSTYSRKFREKVEKILPFAAAFFPFKSGSLKEIEEEVKKGDVFAIIIEPIQGRAGIRPAPPELLHGLRKITSEYKVPLVFDEVYTGFYKTGKPFAKDLYGVEPDLIALGKALSAAFPLSACMGKPWVMDAWGKSTGEASYTFTFSGNPFFCRVALRTLREYERIEAGERARRIQLWMEEGVGRLPGAISHRGIGVLHGFDFGKPGEGFRAFRWLLKRGWITLPSGLAGEALEIIPPFTVEREVLSEFLMDLSAYLGL